MAAASGIHGKSLEITVVGCSKLRDTEWFCRQDPYVCLEYGSTKFRTKTCTDGGRKAQFHEKFVLTLIEGLRELEVSVFNENNITYDDFIGRGKVQLHKVLSTGFDDSPWSLQSGSGRYAAGEVRLIMHYSAYANTPATSHAHAPPYGVAPPVFPHGVAPPVSPYGAAPPVSPYGVAHASFPQNSPYPYAPPSQSTYAPSQARPSPNQYRPQQPPGYPPPPPSQGVYPQQLPAYPPPPPSQGVYPHSPYNPPPPPSSYPPSPYAHHMSSTYPDPTPYPHPSRDVGPEPESTHFHVDYQYYNHEC